jgi:UTP--glucose-1-phosphate uridylyltransferase
LISKCLFPAAGYGTRFLPATKAVPKEMLPILNKPLLQYGVEEALSAGIKNMAIVTGRGKRSIEDHFDNSFELKLQLQGTSKEHYLEEIDNLIDKASFTYVRQQKMLGLGNAILTGEPLIGNEAFAVILADDLCDSGSNNVISQMVKIYKKYKCSIVAIEEVSRKDVHNYGIVSGQFIDGSDNIIRVNSMIEKPSENELKDFDYNNVNLGLTSGYMGIIGRYILTPDIFEILKNTQTNKNNEVQITDALLKQALDDKVIAFKFSGNRFDCGTVEGFVKATNYFAKSLGV